MLDSLVESPNRTVRSNRILIALRLILATVSLAILLLQEARSSRVVPGRSRPVPATGEVSSMAFSADGKHLYTGGSDATVRIWDMETHDALSAAEGIQGHGDIVLQITPSPDGKTLASASADGSVRLYDLAAEKWVHTLSHDGPVSLVAWSPDGMRLISGGRRLGLSLWDTKTGERIARAKAAESAAGGKDAAEEDALPPEFQLTFAAFLHDGKRVLTTGTDGTIRLWDAETLVQTEVIPAHVNAINAAALSPGGKYLVTASLILRLWELPGLTQVRSFEGHTDLVTTLCFEGDDNHFLSGSRDGNLMLWSVNEAKPVRTFGKHMDWILAAALAPDGNLAATGTFDRAVRLWDTATGQEKDELVGHRSTLRTAVLQPDFRSGNLVQPLPLYLQPVGLVLIIVCVLTIFYLVLLRRKDLAPKLATLQVLVDIGLISALVYDTGSVNSPFVTLYLVSVTAAAFVISWRGAILVAAMAATFFSLTMMAYGLGKIPETFAERLNSAQLLEFRSLKFLDYVRLLLLPICAFFLVAGLAGHLSRRLAVARILHNEVVEGIGEGIIVLDLDLKVLYHNDELRNLLLLKGSQHQKALRELLGDQVHERAAQAMADQNGRRLEVNHRRPDGMILPFEVRVLPVRDPDGPPRGLIVVVDDITAEKKMEEFFKHKERIEAMGQISASIAHEIRNPLASIRGAVQEIARSVEIPESKKILVDIVMSESDRLDKIISDFLRYARMRQPKLAEVDLANLLSELRMMLVTRDEAKGVEVRLEEVGEVEPFPADSEQLRQIFLNLGVNALQAVDGRPEKKVLFKLQSASRHQAQSIGRDDVAPRVDRPGVLVEIQDTGGGMAPEVMNEIFEPFFTTKAEGTGLGLAIVARMVQGHEGFIDVKSHPGQGTTFRIWLPTDLKSDRTSGLRQAVEEAGLA